MMAVVVAEMAAGLVCADAVAAMTAARAERAQAVKVFIKQGGRMLFKRRGSLPDWALRWVQSIRVGRCAA